MAQRIEHAPACRTGCALNASAHRRPHPLAALALAGASLALAVSLAYSAATMPTSPIVAPVVAQSEREVALDAAVDDLTRYLVELEERQRRTLAAAAGSAPVPTMPPSRDVQHGYNGPR